MRDCVSFWMVPRGSARKYFEGIIVGLSERFGAPTFSPHLTVFVSKLDPFRAVGLAGRAAEVSGPFRLTVKGIAYSPEFTKTLFVEFDNSPALTCVYNFFKQHLPEQATYSFRPHVSLMYRTMPIPELKALADGMTLSFSQVGFDIIQAVSTPHTIATREDVECWEVLCAKELSKKQS